MYVRACMRVCVYVYVCIFNSLLHYLHAHCDSALTNSQLRVVVKVLRFLCE